MTLCKDGQISLGCFLAASVLVGLPEVLLRIEFDSYLHDLFRNIWFIHVFQFVFLNLLVLLAFRGFVYQVAVRSVFLGYTLGIGIIIALFAPESWKCFGMYMSVLSTFHYSEFLAIAWSNPKAVSIDSFVLRHSVAYGIAAGSSWLEFFIERQYFPGMKEISFITYLGMLMCACGEALRKLAMFTAKHNFNHLVQTEKSADHELVTHGVYKLCRHPSYVGWFYWSIGTQLILQNPFCLLAYTIASWRFFHDRVVLEEITLLNFFGDDYVNYQKEVGTGLPFISGYKIDT
ncbi:protein-S-isoprenylcysteine O-methyltransferase [Diachasmimorpha longicaudata]|uniref:protein-S-isoprenylcysteine O-methyltransferase n=1 Tax=Diachasmimorpha longicaudata TaxID=58733 RepID=UPI0030B907AE